MCFCEPTYVLLQKTNSNFNQQYVDGNKVEAVIFKHDQLYEQYLFCCYLYFI